MVNRTLTPSYEVNITASSEERMLAAVEHIALSMDTLTQAVRNGGTNVPLTQAIDRIAQALHNLRNR